MRRILTFEAPAIWKPPAMIPRMLPDKMLRGDP